MTPGVSDLLGASLRLYRSSFSLLSGYLAWLLVPHIGFVLVSFLPEGPLAVGLGAALTAANIALVLWVGLVCIRLLSAASTGRYEALVQAPHAAARFGSFLSASVLQMLVVAGGLLLFVLPGIVFAVWYGFAPIAAAVDGQRGLGALAASRALSLGRFRQVAWRLLAGPLVLAAWYAVLMSLLFLPLMAATGTSMASLASDSPPLWFLAFDAVGQIFFLTPLLLAYLVLLYHALVPRDSSGPTPSL